MYGDVFHKKIEFVWQAFRCEWLIYMQLKKCLRLCWNVCATSQQTIYIFESIMYWSVICVILSCIFYHKRRLFSPLLRPLALLIIIILKLFFCWNGDFKVWQVCNLCFIIYHLVNCIGVSPKMVLILHNMSILCTTMVWIYILGWKHS
jgi:hypothetical protein